MSIEQIHVRDVYDKIADEFSDTRYRPWSCVEDFLDKIPPGSKVADIGCGNGKNMLYKPELEWKGCDFSKNLVEICLDRGLNVIMGDALNIPYNSSNFDYTICIAVIHHLSTEEKRMKAISELIRITKKDGIVLILVWGLEQPEGSRRRFIQQDNYVNFCDKSKKVLGKRYYYVFQKDELEGLLPKNVMIIKSIHEKGNYGVIIQKF
jgi:ubiquinone/menaquinone biosynthesis C-methylase UbiE